MPEEVQPTVTPEAANAEPADTETKPADIQETVTDELSDIEGTGEESTPPERDTESETDDKDDSRRDEDQESEEAEGEEEESDDTDYEDRARLDPVLVEDAVRAGVPYEKIQQMKSDAEIYRAKREAESRAASQQSGGIQESDFQVKLKPEDYSEELIGEMQRIANLARDAFKTVAGRVEPIEQQVQMATQAAIQAEGQTRLKQFHQFCDSQDDLRDLVGDATGKGERGLLGQKNGRKLLAAREKFCGIVVDELKLAAAKGERPDFDAILEAAKYKHFGPQLAKLARKQVLSKATKRADMAVGRPGGTSGRANGDGKDRSLDAVQAILRRSRG